MKWIFNVHSDNVGDSHTMGEVEAPSADEAYMRGCAMYVSVGFRADHYAARQWGGHERDYPDAFFAVHELDQAAPDEDDSGDGFIQHFQLEKF